jgi:hypothetical protein
MRRIEQAVISTIWRSTAPEFDFAKERNSFFYDLKDH